MTPTSGIAKDTAADMSDSNLSEYDYSYDEDDKNAQNDAASMIPEAFVVGERSRDENTTTSGGGGTSMHGLERSERSGDKNIDDNDNGDSVSLENDDDDDDERTAKYRRLDSSTTASTSAVWVPPTAVATADDRAAAVETAASTDDSPSLPFQTEIKTQRPLGLLAHHRLQTSATTSYRTDRGRALESSGKVDEQRQLREMLGRRLTQAELEAAMAMQERMSGGSYCNVSVSSAPAGSGFVTSLTPTPSSGGVGLDYTVTSRYDSLMDRRFMPSPPLSSASPCSSHDDSASPLDATSSTSGHRQWTFQEQFKQVPLLSFTLYLFYQAYTLHT